MASINNLTPDSVANDPWAAIELAVRNNPSGLAIAFANYTDLDVPEDPDALMAWIHDYYDRHGHLDMLIQASKDVPMILSGRDTLPLAYQKSGKDGTDGGGGGGGFDWGGFLGGIFQGAGSALGGFFGQNNGSDAEYIAAVAAQQAAESRKTMTMVLIAFGVLVIGVVAFVTLKK